ncbi:hypothetical protein [Fibrella forsythiae]|uniref:WYL domain-containing protein n=1 Tax=Fibrella forsythiae TaxID=2817061 RepID=A0ABS3JT80_9BACT|nr:hypothetical protein [Fibrella forsythiae]MBO0953225.1 hypothetical protein [Fibrella forsythiae]
MKSTIFEARPLVEQSLMQRILGQRPSQNAVIELNNLLATQPIESITPADLTAIEAKYGLQLNQYQLNLEEFYAVHLNYRLGAPQLRLEELSDIVHLQTIFQLPISSVQQLHSLIGEGVYRRQVEQAIQYGYINEADKEALAKLSQWLSLTTEAADRIYSDVCQSFLSSLVDELGAKARLSPDNLRRLNKVSQGFGVKPSAQIKQIMDRYGRYWTIESMPLPVLEVGIPLQKSERCFFQTSEVNWFEERATIRRANYTDHYEQYQSFDSVDLDSVKVPVQKDTFAILKLIHTGRLYLTNKRLLFESREKTTVIKFESIYAIKTYKQGLLIRKATGKDVLLLMAQDADRFTLIYRQLLSGLPS